MGFVAPFEAGTRIFVLHALQRTVFPRAISGIERTFRQVRFGHMIRTIFWSPIRISSSGSYLIGRTGKRVVSKNMNRRLIVRDARISRHIPLPVRSGRGLRGTGLLWLQPITSRPPGGSAEFQNTKGRRP